MFNFKDSPAAQFIKRLSATAVFYTAAVIVVPPPGSGEFQSHVSRKLEDIIEKQQEVLGFEMPEERPVIHFHLPPAECLGSYGCYDRDKNEIYLYSDTNSKEWDFHAALNTLNHELGHWFLDTTSERLGKGSWPHYHEHASREERTALRLLSEGMATYIARKIRGTANEFNPEAWPQGIKQFYPEFFLPLNTDPLYDGGDLVVSPIIDRYGQEGIEYLMFHPPEGKELFNPQQYQNRILQQLKVLHE